MGQNHRIPPSQRYAHLAGAVAAPGTVAPQAERLLAALRRGPVTTTDCAAMVPPITSLGSVVWRLRQDGHNIHQERRWNGNGGGAPSVYRLIP